MGEVYDKLREELLTKEIEDIHVDESMTICDLIDLLGKSHGFMAGHVYRAAEIIHEMIKSGNVLKILSFTGNIVATGLRGLISQILRERMFDIVITTCGAIDHDIARGRGGRYYAGEWIVDDAMLNELMIHRLGNVFIPFENYGLTIENFTRELLDELVKIKREWSPSELLYHAGLKLRDDNSFLRSAALNNIPVFVPGIFDGAFGTNIVLHSQFSNLKIDIISDEKKLLDMVFAAEKIGALIIGGGISKHHTIWYAQFKNGLDYAVYVTTAVEYDGSLSGAHSREAISWGKIKPMAKHIVVYGDATIILPLIIAGVKCLIKRG